MNPRSGHRGNRTPKVRQDTEFTARLRLTNSACTHKASLSWQSRIFVGLARFTHPHPYVRAICCQLVTPRAAQVRLIHLPPSCGRPNARSMLRFETLPFRYCVANLLRCRLLVFSPPVGRRDSESNSFTSTFAMLSPSCHVEEAYHTAAWLSSLRSVHDRPVLRQLDVLRSYLDPREQVVGCSVQTNRPEFPCEIVVISLTQHNTVC